MKCSEDRIVTGKNFEAMLVFSAILFIIGLQTIYGGMVSYAHSDFDPTVESDFAVVKTIMIAVGVIMIGSAAVLYYRARRRFYTELAAA
ncbi:MAG: hypothetical protein IH630_02770 [Thermoplasmata archaeon]|nr:hypothetical protein [Thermoplasmata archaeon]